MEDEEVKTQLDHMVKFIYREADEKASEIQAKANEEFSIEKQTIVSEEKIKIVKEFERKEKQIDITKKIKYSNELNQMRLRILKTRDEGIRKVFEQAHKQLINLTKDKASYKTLLKDLIVQSLVKLDESEVSILCREQDLSLVEGVLKEAEAQFKTLSSKPTKISLNKEHFLPPGPEKGNEIEFCSGGVVLTGYNGKIVCSNTLDARLSMAFEGLLPQIRETLFGKSLTRKHFD